MALPHRRAPVKVRSAMAAGDTREISMSAVADGEAGIGDCGLGARSSSAWSAAMD